MRKKEFSGFVAYMWNTFAMLLLVAMHPVLSPAIQVPITEELLKYVPFLTFRKKLDVKIYVVVTALLWTVIETATVLSTLMHLPIWYVYVALKLLPHALFGFVFYHIQKKSTLVALAAAVLMHITWNSVVLLLN